MKDIKYPEGDKDLYKQYILVSNICIFICIITSIIGIITDKGILLMGSLLGALFGVALRMIASDIKSSGE